MVRVKIVDVRAVSMRSCCGAPVAILIRCQPEANQHVLLGWGCHVGSVILLIQLVLQVDLWTEDQDVPVVVGAHEHPEPHES